MEGLGGVVMSCWEMLLTLLMLVDVGDAVEMLLNSIEVEGLNQENDRYFL